MRRPQALEPVGVPGERTGRLDVRSGWLTWANAGHAPALLVRPDGSHAVLEATGTVLGVFDHTEWSEERVLVPKGGVLVLLSDGVVEAARAAASELAPDRLADVVRAAGPRADAATILHALQTAVEAGLKGERPPDDHTFVVLRRDAL